MTTATGYLPLYTADEYSHLVETGQLGPDDRVELLEGVIVEMSPQGIRHASGIRRVDAVVRAAFPDHVISVQLPFRAGSRSEPEPDVSVVPGEVRNYDKRHPDRAVLMVEVSDSSLVQDRLTKARIYAAAGVPEYWIVNLVDDVLEVYRSPDAEARLYRETTTLDRTAAVRPLNAPHAEIRVADLLP